MKYGRFFSSPGCHYPPALLMSRLHSVLTYVRARASLARGATTAPSPRSPVGAAPLSHRMSATPGCEQALLRNAAPLSHAVRYILPHQ